MAEAFPPLKKLLNDPELDAAARACEGLDGRQIRKLVAAACTFDKRVAADPSKLSELQPMAMSPKAVTNKLPVTQGCI